MLIKSHKNMHDNYGFEINDPDTIEELEASYIPKRPIQGTPWYQILANQRY